MRFNVRLLPLIVFFALLASCGGDPPPLPERAPNQGFRLDVEPILRGTVGQEAILDGFRPVLVQGYGLVVGLRGTGSTTMPPQLRAHMREELIRRGVGSARQGLEDLKPDTLLDSPETAVVIVEGVLPPGSVGRRIRRGLNLEGTRFDLRVVIDPRTDATSLEGGRLYTCNLFPATPGNVLPPTGSFTATALADARGPILVNPFAKETAAELRTSDQGTGRILRGGEATMDMPLKLRLAQPSHARVEIIQSAINTRFPQEPGQPDPTARGESGDAIRITVPRSWRDRPDEFEQLLKHTTLRQTRPESVANSIKQMVLTDPQYSGSAAWRWEAIGSRSLPTVRDLYDHPDEQPRVAAIRAGARLDDPMVIPHLVRMTQSDSALLRREAISFVRSMRLDPRLDKALAALLNDDDLEIRLAAYEVMLDRAAPEITRIPVGSTFVLDLVESEHPMIFVAQIGQPRIALFGPSLKIQQPVVIDLWSGRFMMQSMNEADRVEVFYRPDDGNLPMIMPVSTDVAEFVRFLGHRTKIESPGPGLGMTYGQTIGVLYHLVRDGCLRAEFKADQDRVLAAINRRRDDRGVGERPEFEAVPETERPEESGFIPMPQSPETP